MRGCSTRDTNADHLAAAAHRQPHGLQIKTGDLSNTSVQWKRVESRKDSASGKEIMPKDIKDRKLAEASQVHSEDEPWDLLCFFPLPKSLECWIWLHK